MAYGRGIYMSDRPGKCNQYGKRIILSRVLFSSTANNIIIMKGIQDTIYVIKSVAHILPYCVINNRQAQVNLNCPYIIPDIIKRVETLTGGKVKIHFTKDFVLTPSKVWQASVLPDRRNDFVHELILAMVSDPKDLPDSDRPICNPVVCAKKAEGEIFEAANSKSEYLHLLKQSIFKIKTIKRLQPSKTLLFRS